MEEKNICPNPNDGGIIKKIKKVLYKENPEFTAKYAWIETTYGQGNYRSLEERIKGKQKHIRHQIEMKFPSRGDGYRSGNANSAYRCVVDIEDDLLCCVDEIFKPFVEGGFKVVNLSKCVQELQGENVFLISWKMGFQK